MAIEQPALPHNPTSFLPPLSRLSNQSTSGINNALSQLKNLYWPPPPDPLPSRISLPQRSIKNLIHDATVPDSGYASAEEDEEDLDGAVNGFITHVAPPSSFESGKDDEDELDVLRADPLEKAFAIKWLTGFICRSDIWAESFCEDGDEGVEGEDEEYEARTLLVDTASSLLSAFTSEDNPECEDGEDADDSIIRRFGFPRAQGKGIEVELNDASLLDNDHTSVGLQSWGSSIRFGEKMCREPERFSLLPRKDTPLRILELGAGTGLLSIVTAKLLQGADHPPPTIVATDYHPDVLANLELNVRKNFPSSNVCPIQVLPLDWSCPTFSSPFNEKFDIIFAADCIYEPEHARWIRSCIQSFLREDGVFWMIMALRPSGRHEGLEETVLEKFGSGPECKGKQLKIFEMREEAKQDGIGRADEEGYRVFRIGWV